MDMGEAIEERDKYMAGETAFMKQIAEVGLTFPLNLREHWVQWRS